jgi:DNA-binding IclR family transcriptional regulator
VAVSERDTQISSNGAQTLARGLRVVEFVTAADEPQRPSEIARGLGLDRNAVYRLLQELEANAYVTKASDRGGYVVGSGLIALAAMVMRRVDLRRLAQPYMEKIGEVTGETVGLYVRHNHNRVCVETVPGRHTVRQVVQIGETLPLHTGPSGKAILAFIDPEEAESILAEAERQGLDAEQIRSDLKGIRTVGYIASVGDRTPGVRVGGLAVPIFTAQGIGAALTVSGPASRWTQEAMESSAETVKEMCSLISESLGYRAAVRHWSTLT